MSMALRKSPDAMMIRHRVGVRVKDVYEVRKIDESYFVE
jgi:restriction endonuclease Mrr